MKRKAANETQCKSKKKFKYNTKKNITNLNKDIWNIIMSYLTRKREHFDNFKSINKYIYNEMIQTNYFYNWIWFNTDEALFNITFDKAEITNLFRCRNFKNLSLSGYKKFVDNSRDVLRIKNFRLNITNDLTKLYSSMTNLVSLNIDYCFGKKIKNKIQFYGFKKLKKLTLKYSNLNLHIDAFKNLENLEELNIENYMNSSLNDFHFKKLNKLKILNMANCNQCTLTDKMFENLTNLEVLNMSGCNQDSLTNKLFKNLINLKSLDISKCNQRTINGNAFKELINLRKLDMTRCNKLFLDNKSFENLVNLKELVLNKCNQKTFTEKILYPLKKLTHLKICGCKQMDISSELLYQFNNINQITFFLLDRTLTLDIRRIGKKKMIHFRILDSLYKPVLYLNKIF